MANICFVSLQKRVEVALKTYAFCAYFDHRYFDRGMAMHESLLQHCPDARLWVLCLSDECYRALKALNFPSIVPVRLAEFEAENPALAVAKANRSLIEYYFTCTASLMGWILMREPEIETLTYVDGDLYFFSGVAPIFEAFKGYSSLIIEHRFPPTLQHMAIYGKYNVGWMSFRRDADGLAALHWWRDRCLEWCYDHLDGDRFADQKYLDRFPGMFRNVLVLAHPGANLAAWNMGYHKLSAQDGEVLVDGEKLIFCHFHNFKRVLPYVWRTYHHENAIPGYTFLSALLYRPYARALARARRLGSLVGLKQEAMLKRGYRGYGFLKNIAKMVAHGDYVIGP